MRAATTSTARKVFRSCDNVLLDIGGNECNAGYVQILVDHVGADRVIFGTDMPGRSFPSQLAKVLGADIAVEAKEKILYENMARVLAETKTIENPSSICRPVLTSGTRNISIGM